MSDIILPHQWQARPHQRNFFNKMLPTALGGKGRDRGVYVWHRRAGKDSTSLNYTAVMTQHKVATYWHMLPTALQGRKVVWEAIDPRTGQRSIDQAFPKELRSKINNTDMRIEFKNGSSWQVVGSDNYDNLVGSNPHGVVFSEYSIANPAAWDYISPILLENGGWALFIYTPRGKNHGSKMFEQAVKNPLWEAEILTIDETFRENGVPVFTQEQFQREIDEGKDPLLLQQEYYCSFDAGLAGAYYTHELKRCKIGNFPWNPLKPVHTFWDIGISDATSIWFGQESATGEAINIIDYETGKNRSFPQWIQELNSKGYTYGIHSMPHDFKKRSWKDGKSAYSVAMDYSFDVEITPDIPRSQGIDAVRTFLPRCQFDKNHNVMAGLDGLSNYRREYNQKLNVWLDRPLHDWAADPADAFRYMALAWPENYHRTGQGQYKVIKTHSSIRELRGRGNAMDLARAKR